MRRDSGQGVVEGVSKVAVAQRERTNRGRQALGAALMVVGASRVPAVRRVVSQAAKEGSGKARWAARYGDAGLVVGNKIYTAAEKTKAGSAVAEKLGVYGPAAVIGTGAAAAYTGRKRRDVQMLW